MTLPDPEDVLTRGRDARDLLSSPVFLAAVDALSLYHVTAAIASPVGAAGRETREHHHTLHFAVSEIVAQLQGWVQVAAEFEKHATHDDEED